MKKKIYFFDMDGTLVDSMQWGWEKVILKYLDDRSIKYPDTIITDLVTKGFMGIANYYVNVLGVKEDPQALYDYFMVSLDDMYLYEYPEKPGATEAIKRIREKGYGVNVISGSPLRFVIPCLKRLGLYDLLDNVFSLEEFGYTKSDKELFLKLAERMETDPADCVVIDDSVNAIKTAKSAGFQTVGIYESIVKNTWDEMGRVADKTVMSFHDLTIE